MVVKWFQKLLDRRAFILLRMQEEAITHMHNVETRHFTCVLASSENPHGLAMKRGAKPVCGTPIVCTVHSLSPILIKFGRGAMNMYM